MPLDGDLSWLSDLDQPLIIADRSWRRKQEQLRALPRWFYEPPDNVRRILLSLRGEAEEMDEITDSDWEDLRAHLSIDFIAFLWFFCFYKDRNTRRKRIATPSAPQLAWMWRFMFLHDEGVPVRMLLLKERQGGFSWVICHAVLWLICFNQHLNALHVAHEKKATQRIFSYLKEGHEWLIDELRPMKDYSSRGELYLRNPDEEARRIGDEGQDSRAFVDTAGNDFAGTSEPVQVAHVSEIGKWDKVCDPETVYASFANAIQDEPGTYIFGESTAHGAQTFFHHMWLSAMKIGSDGWSGFTPIFLPWYLDERNVKLAPPDMKLQDRDDGEFGNEVYLKEYFDLTLDQLEWRRRAIMKQPEGRAKVETFNQEHPSTPDIAWLFAHGRWVPADLLQAAQARLDDQVLRNLMTVRMVGDLVPHRETIGIDVQPLEKGEANDWLRCRNLGAFTVYRWPDWRHDYILGADVSEGGGGDSSCIKVYQRIGWQSEQGAPMRLAAEWYGMVGEDVLADILWRLGWFYSTGRGRHRLPALLAWERTGPGRGIAAWLRKGKTADDTPYPHIRMYRRHEPDTVQYSQDSHYGISTNRTTKPVIMGEFLKAVREGNIQLNAKDIQELATVTRDERGLLETQGRDRVMACALANYGALYTIPMHGQDDAPKPELNPRSVAWTIANAHGELEGSYEDTEEQILT